MTENDSNTDGTDRERIGRLVVDEELNEIAMGALTDAINGNSPFIAERQTGMRIDVFRSVDAGEDQ